MDHETRRLDEPALPPPCPKCSGERVEGEVTLIGDNAGFRVARRFAGQGFLGLDKLVNVTCTLLICLDCGYTEFYAQDLRKLLGDKPAP
jgi:predicted nucleic-acid-binding Zn-ribbon protein